jgi:hypothetical protein
MSIFTPIKLPSAAKLLTFSFLALSPMVHGATTLWEVNLNFDEYTGQPGGWEPRTTNFSYVEYANKNTPGTSNTTREYSIITETGVDPKTGRPLMSEGQNIAGEPLSVTTKIMTSAGNTWSRLRGGISNQGMSSQAEVSSNTSRPGDWGVVAYQFDIPAAYDVDAANFAIRLDNVNGSGELYEWAFVTLNERNIENPGFDMADFDSYGGEVYNDLSSSTYFNPDGTVKAGGTARPTTRLPNGKTISQHLAGQAAGPASENVEIGWYAADMHSARVNDGPEDFDNPSGGTGFAQNVFDVNAQKLGVDPETKVTSFTVWMGYFDVAFDTNGNGTTRTGPNSQIGQISSVKLGATDFTPAVPEPSGALCAILALFGSLIRRRRP